MVTGMQQPSRALSGSPAEQSAATIVEGSRHRADEFTRHELFALLNTLVDQQRRGAFLSCIQRFSRTFQTMMLTRQAMCADPRFYTPFLMHLREEFGHDELLDQTTQSVVGDDAVLEATLTWFSYQMIVLDNVEKAALVHLVLEASGDLFLSAADRYLSAHLETDFFSKHAELDEGHTLLGLALLENQHPQVYGRVDEIVQKGWDMMDAIADRIVEIVNSEKLAGS